MGGRRTPAPPSTHDRFQGIGAFIWRDVDAASRLQPGMSRVLRKVGDPRSARDVGWRGAIPEGKAAMTESQRVAIVTGAAGGIGRAMTRGLLAAGIRVAGVDRDREPLEALAASAREQGKAADLLTIQADLTNDSAAD